MKPRRTIVMFIGIMSEYFVLRSCISQKLHSPLIHPFFPILIVEPRENPSAVAHFAEHFDHSLCVSESIELPTHFRQKLCSEVFGDEPVTPRIVVDEVCIVRGRFVRRRDSAVHELQLPVEH
jgi:hypothetical protein